MSNASFETLGDKISEGKYHFGAPWESNVTPAEFGIRIGTRKIDETESYILVWRGTENTNYISQKIDDLSANTPYKIKFKQVDGGNSGTYFNVGFGSSAEGMEYCSTYVKLGKDISDTEPEIDFITPSEKIGRAHV